VCTRRVVPHGHGLRVEFTPELGALVGADDIEPSPEPPGLVAVPTRLEDGDVTVDLLDPVRSLFRHPEEACFWDRIATDSLDATARAVYADWLDDHGDPHAWVFREPRPFRLAGLRLDWVWATGRVACGPPQGRPLWAFARTTGRGWSVPFTLSDGTPVPPLVAYLLAVTRLRADPRIPDAERDLIAGRARTVGLTLFADVLVGLHDEPICRVTDPARTAALLGEMVGVKTTPSALAARLREVNEFETLRPPEEPRSGQDTMARPDEDDAEDGQWPGPMSDAPEPADLIAQVRDSFRRLAHQMFQSFPGAEEWELQAEDLLQERLVRLFRVLDATSPVSVRHFYNLAAIQIRRLLLDLADRRQGPPGVQRN
jgi:uncharacterized protein (TIGR02996 family)